MGSIFKILGDLLGYVLLFFLEITKNYGMAIILFTLFIKVLMVPMDIKRQKSTAKNAKFSKKQMELKKRYAKDQVKFNEELNKLYEKEGTSPFNGCFSMFFPLFIILGVFSSVNAPLTSTFHFPENIVNQAIETVKSDPDLDSVSNSRYPQIDVFSSYVQKPEAFSMFSQEQSDVMKRYRDSFTFLGMDLLDTPKSGGFSSMLWIIPLLCFATSALSTFLIQKVQGGAQSQMGKGCMGAFAYFMSLGSAWFSYEAPVAVGMYWIVSTLFGIAQSLVFNKFYSVEIISAREEAERIALRLQQESLVTKK